MILIILILAVGSFVVYSKFFAAPTPEAQVDPTDSDPAYKDWHKFTSTIHGYTVKYPPSYTYQSPIANEEPSGMVQFEKPEKDTNFTLMHPDGIQFLPPKGTTDVEAWLKQVDYLQPGDKVTEHLTIAGAAAIKVENRDEGKTPFDYYYFIHGPQMYRIEIFNPQIAAPYTDMLLKSFRFYNQADQSHVFRDKLSSWWNGIIMKLMIPTK